ncbi:MAG: amidohydrolase family protein, partial [Chloroflexi bacterium]|nr:amidohydrolase family protein [Chloroflexota bacterium]
MASSKALCISADSHVVESAEFFQPLQKRFGEKAPRMVTVDPNKGPQLDLGNGQLGIGLSGFFMADVDFTRPDIVELYRKGYDLARPGCYDVAERLKDQELDGVDAEVLYPSVLFNVYQIENLDIVKATFSLYNDWTADYCSDAKDRLFGLACVQLFDLDEAIQEMERSKKLGHVGLCIPATAPPDRLYSDPYYDRFWAAAQAMQMPLTMHIFTGATPNHGLPFRQAGSPLAFAGV